MATFYDVRLTERLQEASGLVLLRFDVDDTPITASFQTPGQYVQAYVPGGDTGYFAIASVLGAEPLELLLKEGGKVADQLLAVEPGTVINMTDAAGRGYPTSEHRGNDVLLFAVGSGLAPIRSLIWELVKNRDEFGRVELFYGARTRMHVPWREELEMLQAENIGVHRVLSQEPAPRGWYGGRVQDVVSEVLGSAKLQRPVAFVCGMKEMVADLRESLGPLGVDAKRVLQNF